MKKKIVIVVIIISLLIVIVGIGLMFLDSNKSEEEPKKIESDLGNPEPGLPAKIIKNNNEGISKTQCLEDICIKDMVISVVYKDDIAIDGVIKNNSNEVISNRFFNIIFTVKGKEIKMWNYIDTIQPNEEISFQLGDDSRTLLSASEYKITNPSNDEILEYSKELNNSN